jgi:hypothetical protein
MPFRFMGVLSNFWVFQLFVLHLVISPWSFADEGSQARRCVPTRLSDLLDEVRANRREITSRFSGLGSVGKDEILAAIRADRRELESMVPEVQHIGQSRDKTVTIGEKIEEGSARGARRVVRKKAKGVPWVTKHWPGPLAPPGTPLFFPFAMDSPEVGRFFGFGFPDPETALMPLSQRFNWAIDELKRLNPDIVIGVRMKKADALGSDRQFVVSYSREGSLLVAEDGGYFLLHDMNYHAAAVLIPPAAHDLARRQSGAFLDFMDFVKAQDPGLFSDPRSQGFFDACLHNISSGIDRGTANPTLRLVVGNYKGAGQVVFDVLTSQGISPKSYLASQVETGIRAALGIGPGVEDVAERLRKLEDQFVRFQEGDPGFSTGLSLTADDYAKQLQERQRSIKVAVHGRKLARPTDP